MKIYDLICISVKNTLRNFRNTILSSSAIAIGISSVILISGVGSSVKAYAQEKINNLGIDGLTLWNEGSESRLDPDFSKEIENSIEGIDICVPFVFDTAKVELCRKDNQAICWGVGERLSEAISIDLVYGRDIDRADIVQNKRVAVVDEELARDNYMRSNIIGKQIKLNINGKNELFEVIGVIKSQSNSFSTFIGNIDRFVYIPYTVQNEINHKSGVNQIAVKCIKGANTEYVCKQIIDYMNTYHPIDGKYNIENISSHLLQMNDIMSRIIMLVTAIGGISIIVAGIGVINGMVSGVVQRKREIGLYMSVGALSWDIICDIILETVIICFIGALIGIALGIGGTYIIIQMINVEYLPELRYILISLAVCVLCSMFFGLIPAIKAAKTEPAEVLRITE